ncbi:long-chain fatty acid--CoA ligase [Rhodobacteraceae bacterium RKSG542]|uniref:AMP-dependent synthetase/ligase n=1 Tax=Pseudovibrio flavus TaxID=2529854 RepID=UPI0012BD516B|nr:long-chain fatty acid--CoA ligase [Pseudovibrio flavus]MTI16318.1 long-chain fatty acid--CoA ligase [Pseudovibrio flavus]
MNTEGSHVVTAHDNGSFVSIPKAFLRTVEKLKDHPAYHVRTKAGWEPTSWLEYSKQVRKAAVALIKLGVRPGDTVCILSYNRPEWAIMDVAAMMIGATPTGIYWTAASPEINYILRHSQGRVLLIESEEQLADLETHPELFMYLRKIVRLNGEAVGEEQITWADFVALADNEPELEEELDRRLDAIHPEDIAKQIYTSGTTGHPKAVQLSHRAIRAESDALVKVRCLDTNDRYISYLPLAHIAEQCGTIVQACDNGYQSFYAQSIQAMPDHLKEVRPTIFFGVPRVFEKMRERIEERLASATGVKAKLAHWAMDVSERWHALNIDNKPTGYFLDLQKKLANRLVLDKVKYAMGFDQTHTVVSGGAALSVSILKFFSRLDIVITEVYGQSESCGGTTFNKPGAIRFGSVGQVLDGVEVKIAEDGEILVRGAPNFSGYAHDPEATDKVFQDGWLLTGDLGHLDADGFLFITGRKKDVIVTSGGKNISPALLEGDLTEIPLVEHAVVVGDNRNYLSALLAIDPVVLEGFAKEQGMTTHEAMESQALRDKLQMGIEQINRRHARVEQVRRFEIIKEGLSIESGELTATLKVRRKDVLKNHAALVDAIYKDAE